MAAYTNLCQLVDAHAPAILNAFEKQERRHTVSVLDDKGYEICAGNIFEGVEAKPYDVKPKDLPRRVHVIQTLIEDEILKANSIKNPEIKTKYGEHLTEVLFKLLINMIGLHGLTREQYRDLRRAYTKWLNR